MGALVQMRFRRRRHNRIRSPSLQPDRRIEHEAAPRRGGWLKWEIPLGHYGSFVALIPSPLGIGTLRLTDGSSVQGFVCESQALQGATNISSFGGWRAYIASLD